MPAPLIAALIATPWVVLATVVTVRRVRFRRRARRTVQALEEWLRNPHG